MQSARQATVDGSTLTLVAAYIGDGYLYGASDSPSAYSPGYWLSLSDERDGYELVELNRVPADVAERLMADDFGDGYEAASAAAPYVGETVHVEEPEADDDEPDGDGPCPCGGRIDTATDLCEACGVHHGYSCAVCGQRGYHADSCPVWRDDDGPPVPFALTAEQADALAWLAGRYESARILWDGWEWGDDENAGTIPAADVRAAYRATAGDGGNLGTVPCAGGGLAYAIAEAFEQAGCGR